MSLLTYLKCIQILLLLQEFNCKQAKRNVHIITLNKCKKINRSCKQYGQNLKHFV